MGLKLPAAGLLSQVAKLGSLLVLFLLVLLVPAFLRVPCCYLLFNAIVLALGIQAGLLRRGSTTSSDPIADEDRHRSSQTGQAVTPVSIAASPFQRPRPVHPNDQTAVADDHGIPAYGASKIVDLKTKTKKVVLTMLMKKCPSAASIFFLSALNGSRVGREEKECEEEQEDCKVDLDDGDDVSPGAVCQHGEVHRELPQGAQDAEAVALEASFGFPFHITTRVILDRHASPRR